MLLLWCLVLCGDVMATCLSGFTVWEGQKILPLRYSGWHLSSLKWESYVHCLHTDVSCTGDHTETSDYKIKAFPIIIWFLIPVSGQHSAVEIHSCDLMKQWFSFLYRALLLYLNSGFIKWQSGVLFISCGICKSCWNFLTLSSHWVYCITRIWSFLNLSVFSSG